MDRKPEQNTDKQPVASSTSSKPVPSEAPKRLEQKPSSSASQQRGLYPQAYSGVSQYDPGWEVTMSAGYSGGYAYGYGPEPSASPKGYVGFPHPSMGPYVHLSGYQYPSYQIGSGPAPSNSAWNRDCARSVRPGTLSALAAKSSFHHQPSSTSSLSPNNAQGYISRIILAEAMALNLPPDGHKFSNVHWISALRLLYRWKTTMDETEAAIHGSASAMSNSKDTGNESKMNDPVFGGGPGSVINKSVKAFVDKVLQRESKRRQFSIHWKDCGLKELFEMQHKDGKKMIEAAKSTAPASAGARAPWIVHDEDQSSSFVPFDHPQVGDMLDDYFSGRKRSRDYVEAEKLAKVERQQIINQQWDALTGLSRKKLKDIQAAIEAPYATKIIMKNSGCKTTHEVTLDGYGGAKYNPPTGRSGVQSGMVYVGNPAKKNESAKSKAAIKKTEGEDGTPPSSLASAAVDNFPEAVTIKTATTDNNSTSTPFTRAADGLHETVSPNTETQASSISGTATASTTLNTEEVKIKCEKPEERSEWTLVQKVSDDKEN